MNIRALRLLLAVFVAAVATAAEAQVVPGKTWPTRSPAEVHLSEPKLKDLAAFVGGRGCVVRHGYMVFTWGDSHKSSDIASAFKPVLTTLLLMAVEEGKIPTVDSKLVDFEPRLGGLNGGKDAKITWRHLANQISGYGLVEPPGMAWSYNDYALTLYYDTLMDKVFGEQGTEVLKQRLAEPLQFEDAFTFNAFGPKNRPGRLALSVRDLARVGLLYLRAGKWGERQVLKAESIKLAISSPLSPQTPLTSGKEAPMIAGQRTMGGTRNITPIGPGYYSFNWWLNGTNMLGQRLFVDAPAETWVASGHGGKRAMWIFPAWDLIVCWNDSRIEDHDKSPGNAESECNNAVRIIKSALESAQPPN